MDCTAVAVVGRCAAARAVVVVLRCRSSCRSAPVSLFVRRTAESTFTAVGLSSSVRCTVMTLEGAVSTSLLDDRPAARTTDPISRRPARQPWLALPSTALDEEKRVTSRSAGAQGGATKTSSQRGQNSQTDAMERRLRFDTGSCRSDQRESSGWRAHSPPLSRHCLDKLQLLSQWVVMTRSHFRLRTAAAANSASSEICRLPAMQSAVKLLTELPSLRQAERTAAL